MIIETIRYLILGGTYLGLALGSLPGLNMNRATIALVGATYLVLLGRVIALDFV
ncbi:hypothetical protein [Crocosphaera sp. Alani8]|uniref:hypothetical protein n=1 Tax=Crocosphaera sp. Alani8 TaxID=3038952 RepID=UPI00313A9A17